MEYAGAMLVMALAGLIAIIVFEHNDRQKPVPVPIPVEEDAQSEPE